MSGIAGHYCGQEQPHDAHTWTTPPEHGAFTVVSTHQCAGLSSEIAPGACWDDAGFEGPIAGITFRCELRAGHDGAHECDRGMWGGTAVWMDDES